MADNFVVREDLEAVSIVRLQRPDKLNALSPELLKQLVKILAAIEADKAIHVVVMHGGAKIFAAGADIAAMAKLSAVGVMHSGTRKLWKEIWNFKKPLIAAVNGVAYGGGCELAMSCDIIIAGESARFAQPEIKLGIIPGAGGTQRLAAAMGPYRTMEMVLTGDPISAQEAYEFNLVNRVVADEKVLDSALDLAYKIASRPQVAVKLAREAAKVGVERSLLEGLKMERRNYRMLYDTEDQAEGMAAFLEKRDPNYKHR